MHKHIIPGTHKITWSQVFLYSFTMWFPVQYVTDAPTIVAQFQATFPNKFNGKEIRHIQGNIISLTFLAEGQITIKSYLY